MLLIPVLTGVDGFIIARRRPESLDFRRPSWISLLGAMILAGLINLGVAALYRSVMCEAFVVTTTPMVPTLEVGDRFLVQKSVVPSGEIKRGEVITYRAPVDGAPVFVGRVAGLSGETIEIMSERVFVDGAEWVCPSLEYDHSVDLFTAEPCVSDTAPLLVPKDCVFVLGDNRRRSYDSRMFGPVSNSAITGRVRLIFWSKETTSIHAYEMGFETVIEGPVRWERVGLRVDQSEARGGMVTLEPDEVPQNAEYRIPEYTNNLVPRLPDDLSVDILGDSEPDQHPSEQVK